MFTVVTMRRLHRVALFFRTVPRLSPPLRYSTTTTSTTTANSTLQTIDLVADFGSLIDSSPSSRHLRHIHAQLFRRGLLSDTVLSSRLVLSYSHLGELFSYSLPVFLHMPTRNAYSWSIMVGELSRSGFPEKSLLLFLEMLRWSDVHVDAFTVPIVLRSCATAGALRLAVSVHGLCVKLGLEDNVFVGSALVFMYVAFGEVWDARSLFDKITRRDVVLWTTMLSGYTQSGELELAVGVFREMISECVELDGVVMISLVLLCSQGGWLWHGKSVHGWSVKKCLGLGLSLGNAFVDMYVKCGALHLAERVFGRMPRRDVISWSALILGHGLNGSAGFALELFEKMLAEGVVKPNLVTFLGVLSACTHAGLVDRAWEYWNMMKKCGLVPELKHHACMVDVLGKAGQVAQAEIFIKGMPMEPDEVVWAALLASCRVHGNVEVGERASKRLMAMQPGKSGYYSLLANLYTDAGRFEDAEKVRGVMKQMDVGKVPGCSLIESGGYVLRKTEGVYSRQKYVYETRLNSTKC